MWIGTVTMENSMEVSQQTKNRTTMWGSNPTSRNISEESENTNS